MPLYWLSASYEHNLTAARFHVLVTANMLKH